jgi:D-3-phosphoglycerate dehydrogenase
VNLIVENPLKPTVLLYEPIHADAVALLEQKAEILLARSLDESSLLEQVPAADGIILRGRGKVTRRLMEAAPRLKVVGRHGVGVDHIDTRAASELGIVVVSTPGAEIESVAEHCVGMMIALAKRMVQADQALRAGDWQARYRLTGDELHGKILGVVGFGRIGQRVATLCHTALAMPVIYYDVVDAPQTQVQLEARRVPLDELLQAADVVSLHVPLLPETRRLIGREALRRMKREAFLINTCRGAVVDQAALVEALQEGWIAGAGLDVFDPEPLPPDSPLLRLQNVIVTPHMAALTKGGLLHMAMSVVNDVLAVLEGGVPNHPVPYP